MSTPLDLDKYTISNKDNVLDPHVVIFDVFRLPAPNLGDGTSRSKQIYMRDPFHIDAKVTHRENGANRHTHAAYDAMQFFFSSGQRRNSA